MVSRALAVRQQLIQLAAHLSRRHDPPSEGQDDAIFQMGRRAPDPRTT